MAAGHRVSGRSGGHDKSRCVEGSDQCLDNGQTGSNRITFGLLTNRPLVRMNSPGRAIPAKTQLQVCRSTILDLGQLPSMRSSQTVVRTPYRPSLDCGGQLAKQGGAVTTKSTPVLTGKHRRMKASQAFQNS